MLRKVNNKVLSRRFMAGLTPVLLLGCSAVPMSPGTAMAQTEKAQASTDTTVEEPAERMDGQLMFELMISELAGRRGQLDVAMTGYLRAAERTSDPRVSERAARLAMFGRQWPEAEKATRRWAMLDPDSEEAPQILAQALMRQSKVTQAADQYISVVNASSDQDQALRQLTVELQGAETPQQGVEIMQQVLRAFPENAQSHLSLARAQLQTRDQQAALASVDNALAIAPGDSSALLLKAQLLVTLGRPDEGFSVLQTALSERPDNSQLRLGYAQLLVETRLYKDVGEQLDRLFSDAAGDSDTLLSISLLALDSRLLDQAQIYLTSLLETGEYPDQAHFYLARISDQQQDYETAMAFYDAVQPGELQLRAQIRVAELMALTGNLAQGRERLQQMAASVPNPELQPQLLTAESRMLQNADQSGEAVNVLSDGLSRFPDNSDLLYARALAADAAGNPSMMLEDLNKLIELEPDNAHALNALGYHFADKNIELDRAEELLIKANDLLPGDAAIMDSLGWLRYRQGDFPEAEKWLSEAYAVYPDSEIAAHLSEVLWLHGKEEEARQLLEDALQDDPEDDNLLRVMQKFVK